MGNFMPGLGIDRKGGKQDGLHWRWLWVQQCELSRMPENDKRRLPCPACFAVLPVTFNYWGCIKFKVNGWSKSTTPSYSATVEIYGESILQAEPFSTRIKAQIAAEKLLKDFCRSTLRTINQPRP